jgi:xanthine dehydrogenase small subunit
MLREDLRLMGTKEGCREGDCGACTVLLGALHGDSVHYLSVNSCLLPAGDINGKHLVTIEGLNGAGLSPVQDAMAAEGGTQCGFCTPGFVMSMTGYFLNTEAPNAEDGIEALDGNICRCTGYTGIKRAMRNAVERYQAGAGGHFTKLTEQKFIPASFGGIAERLKELQKQIAQGQPVSGPGECAIVGGGTDLFVQRWDTLLESYISLAPSRQIASGIREDEENIIIGGAATITSVLNSALIRNYFPVINYKLSLFGSLPIRNRATVAGNIVNASPIADIVNILLALNAKITLRGAKGERELPLDTLYLGYKQLDRSPDELIEEIIFAKPKGQYFFNYEKVSRRTYLDIASVNSSIFLTVENKKIAAAGISAGGVAPIPKFLHDASVYLVNRTVSAETVLGCVDTALREIAPISDARGSAGYKKLLLSQMLKTHFIKLFPEHVQPEEVV